MSNTYFRMNIKKTTDDTFYPSYTNDMDISCTAFMGGPDGPHVQLTTQISSTLPGQSGLAYIGLNREQTERLIKALQERLDGKISATGNEVSEFTDPLND